MNVSSVITVNSVFQTFVFVRLTVILNNLSQMSDWEKMNKAGSVSIK
jgi:hypothetical protein